MCLQATRHQAAAQINKMHLLELLLFLLLDALLLSQSSFCSRLVNDFDASKHDAQVGLSRFDHSSATATPKGAALRAVSQLLQLIFTVRCLGTMQNCAKRNCIILQQMWSKHKFYDLAKIVAHVPVKTKTEVPNEPRALQMCTCHPVIVGHG